MSDTEPATQKKSRPLWPWVVGAIVLCLFGAGFSFWWPMYRANELIATIHARGGGVNHTEPSSAWKKVFGNRIHPWFHEITKVIAGPVVRVSFRPPLDDQQVLALTRFRGVDLLMLDISQTSDDVIRELKELDSLEFLQLIGNDRPVPLEWVRELPKLKHIRLNKVRITADSWQALAESPVDSAIMIECPIEASPQIRGSLKVLSLRRVNLTRDVGNALQNLPLHALHVAECNSSPEFWQALSGHSTLKSLGISNPEMDEIDMEGISQIAALEHLSLYQHGFSSMKLNRQHVQLIGKLKHLKTLHLEGLEVPDDDSWIAVAQLPGLRNLELKKCPIGDMAVEALAHSPSLETLILEETNLTDAGLMNLAKLPTLKEISISGSSGITDGGGIDFNNARPDVERGW